MQSLTILKTSLEIQDTTDHVVIRVWRIRIKIDYQS